MLKCVTIDIIEINGNYYIGLFMGVIMKRNILLKLTVILTLLLQAVALPTYAKEIANEIIDFSDEGAELPEASGGEWSIAELPPISYADYDFSKNAGNFNVVYGTWTVSGGKYIQSALSTGAAARNLLPESFCDFTMEFDVTPLSDDTRLMLFFGCTSLYEVCTAGITADGSNIVIGEQEYGGTGHIEKNVTCNVRLEAKNGSLSLYLDGELINEQKDITYPTGQIGIGCWNSKAEFDNFKVIAPDRPGSGKRLIQASDKKAVALINGIPSQAYSFTARLSADALSGGECGIIICADKDKNGYYLGVNSDKAFIRLKRNGAIKPLAEVSFKAQSEKYYNYTAVISGNEIIFKINSTEVLSAKNAELTEGQSGIFSEKTGICCASMGFCDTSVYYSDDAVSDYSVKDFSDIEEEYAEACNVCASLEILCGYSDGTFRGGMPMTRGELSSAIYKILGYEPTNYNPEKSFFDIPEDYPYRNAIISAVNDGYLTAEQGAYLPNNAVTPTEAVYASLKLLGLAQLAELRGIFPTATSAKILDKVKYSATSIDRQNTAQLLLNTILADRVKISGISEYIFTEKSGCFLEDTFSAKKLTGVIGETGFGCAFEDKAPTLEQNEILIDGIKLKYNKDCLDLLGKNTLCYAQLNDYNDEGEVIWLAPYRVDEVKITASQLGESNTKNRIEYYKFESSSKATEIKIPDTCAVIYNGQYYTDITNAPNNIFDIPNGTLTIIYNNKSSAPNLVKVDCYTNYVVDTLSIPNSMIYDKYNKSPLCTDKSKGNTLLMKNGIEISVSELKTNDVLSVSIPKSSNGYTIIRLSDIAPVSGVLKTVEGNRITVGRDAYALSQDIDKTKYSVSDYLTIYFDFNNIIAYITKLNQEDYAYLVKPVYDSEENECCFKMFTFENGKGSFRAAKTVYVYWSNGTSNRYTDSNYKALEIAVNEALSASRVNDSNGNMKKCGVLIKYKMNADGKIREIRFAHNDTAVDLPDGKHEFSCYYDSEISGENAYYYSGLVNSKYRITSSTKILNLSGDCLDTDGYTLLSSGSLLWDEYYDCRIYDVAEDFRAGVMVIYNIDSGYDLPVGIVTGTKGIIDEQDNICLAIEMYKNGSLITEKALNFNLECNAQAANWFKNAGTRLCDLKSGDMIIYQTDAEGYIKEFKLIFKNKQQEFYATSPRGWYWGTIPSTKMTLAYTAVTKKTGDIFVFNSNNYSRPVIKNSAAFYICERNTITPASFDDVKKGDKVTMIWKSAELNTVVIYR